MIVKILKILFLFILINYVIYSNNKFDFIYTKYNIDKEIKISEIIKSYKHFWGSIYIIYIDLENKYPLNLDIYIIGEKDLKSFPVYSRKSIKYNIKDFKKEYYNEFILSRNIQLINRIDYLEYINRIESMLSCKRIINKNIFLTEFEKEYYDVSQINDRLKMFYQEQLKRLSLNDYTIYIYENNDKTIKLLYYSYPIGDKGKYTILNKVELIIKKNGEILNIYREEKYESNIYPDNPGALNILLHDDH